jgi:hypothetical protein
LATLKVVKNLADLLQEAVQWQGGRPFGVQALVVGMDRTSDHVEYGDNDNEIEFVFTRSVHAFQTFLSHEGFSQSCEAFRISPHSLTEKQNDIKSTVGCSITSCETQKGTSQITLASPWRLKTLELPLRSIALIAPMASLTPAPSMMSIRKELESF